MKMPLRLYVALIGALLVFAAGAQAQNYPNRTITIVVPFPPGGLTDVPARVFAAMAQQKIGQNVVAENKAGGNGTIGVAYVSRAAPDGYTLLANSLADAQNVHFVAVPYRPINDFAQIGWIVDGPPAVLAVNGALPYKTLADLIADAKKNPSKISFGTSGPASSPAMALAQLNGAAWQRLSGLPAGRTCELGMTVPLDNTPEQYDAYLRAETVRQGEIAKLTGAALQK